VKPFKIRDIVIDRPKMRKFCLQIFLVAVFLLGVGYGSVSAQQEDWRPQPCEALARADSIFTGVVVGLPVERNIKEDEFVLIEFRVGESFLGAKSGDKVAIRATAGFADYLGIAIGRSFLVYTAAANDSLLMSLDYLTKPLTSAGRDMDFLRGYDLRDPSSRVFGKVKYLEKSSLEKEHKKPLTSAVVSIRSANEGREPVETRTDLDGYYEFIGLPAGDYRVGVKVPDEIRQYTHEHFFRVSGRGCWKEDLDISAVNKVSGKVVDANGDPVKTQLELIPADYFKPEFDVDGPEETSGSNDDGSFSFVNVPPGKYILAVNYTTLPEKESPFPANFFPGTAERGKAHVIEIKPGDEISGLEFVLGSDRLKERKIIGKVIFPDGRPAPDLKVYLKEDENQVCCVLKEAITDANGNFVLAGFISRKYRIWVYDQHKPFTQENDLFGASKVFTLDTDTGEFLIVLMPTNKSSLDAIDALEIHERTTSKK